MLKGQLNLPFAQGKGKIFKEIIAIKKNIYLFWNFQNHRGKNKYVGY